MIGFFIKENILTSEKYACWIVQNILLWALDHMEYV